MAVLVMSDGELSRFDTLMRVDRGELRPTDAARLLGIQRRQIYRLLDRLRAEGAAGLVSSKRGRPSNRRYADDFRERVVAIVREHYYDFGPTLAREYLAERHDIHLACETLRQFMIKAGLWKDREARRPRPYQPRYRRDCRGELIQIDGSKHWWFEDRGPQCTLLVYIDDATSELMHLKMAESESTFAYMDATREYIERHGKPGLLFRQAQRVSERQSQRSTRRWHDAFRTCAGCAEHRDYLRQLAAGQGPGRTGQCHVAGSPGQSDASGRHIVDRGRQRLSRQLYGPA